MSDRPADQPPARSCVRRWLPLAVIVAVSIGVVALGGHRALSFETLVRHHGAIHAFIIDHEVLAVAIYIAIYIAAVALSLPGGLVLTLSGGLPVRRPDRRRRLGRRGHRRARSSCS